jgi:hypothetical protein
VTRAALQLPWVAVAILTLGLGATVALAWFAFGGSAAFRGPLRALEDSWPLIYGAEAILAAAGTYLYARIADPLPRTWLVAYVVAAWIGEYLVLLFGGRLLSGELTTDVSWFFWLIGTGGPIQPVAALLGGLVALRGRPPAVPAT